MSCNIQLVISVPGVAIVSNSQVASSPANSHCIHDRCRLPTEKKPNYLKALSNIINKLPKQVQVTELPAVSSLLKKKQNKTSNQKKQLKRTKAPSITAILWRSAVAVCFQLLSLLLEALSCPDQGVQLSTLSCLQPVLVDPPKVLIQQLEALVSRLLALTTSPAMVRLTFSYANMWCQWHLKEDRLQSPLCMSPLHLAVALAGSSAVFTISSS